MNKNQKMKEIVASLPSGHYEKEYLGFFACFNRGDFYEAHDVLEHLWLKRRKTKDDLFFKALIQLAGAFVHLQKGKISPGRRLFIKSKAYFDKFEPSYRGLSISSLKTMIDSWVLKISKSDSDFSLDAFDCPSLNPTPPQDKSV